MEIETITVVMAIAGAVLLYGAIKNKNPIDVIKLTLQGKDPNTAPGLGGGDSSGGSGATEIKVPVTGEASAAPGVMHDNGKGARFYPNNTPRYTDDPLAADLPDGDPRKKFKSGATDPNGFVMAAKNATRAQGGYIVHADAFGNGGTPRSGYYGG